MRRIEHLAVLLLTAFLMSNCSPSRKNTNVSAKDTSAQNNIDGKYWKLIEIDGKTVSGENNREPHLQFNAGHVSGTGGCNLLSGTYTLKSNRRINFSQMASTQMACENMETDAALAKALQNTDNYTINRDTLSLKKGNEKPLARLVATAQNDQVNALNGSWKLKSISGPGINFEELFPNDKPTLIFRFPETKVGGSGSCNSYNSDVKIEGHYISFGEIASTKMACPGDGEYTYFKSLRSINGYSVSSDKSTLTLLTGDIAVMSFSKK